MYKNLPLRVKLAINLVASLAVPLLIFLASSVLIVINLSEHRRVMLTIMAGVGGFVAVSFVLLIYSSWRFTNRLVDRLLLLQKAVVEVEEGETIEPLPILADDEIGRLKISFNEMNQKLAESRLAMIENTRKLEQEVAERTELFENSPISLWEEDYGAVLACLKASGVRDLRDHFKAHPEELAKSAGLIKALNVNQATLDLFRASDKKQLTSLSQLLPEESYQVLKDALIALFEGKTRFEGEAVSLTLTGERKNVVLKMIALPARVKDDFRVLISITDITGLKTAETGLKQKMKELKEFSDAAIGRELKLEAKENEIAELKKKLERAG